MNISITDALPLFTSKIVAKYCDVQKPKSFGRSYFTEVTTTSKTASVVTERGYNLMASDVPRGARGNLNVFEKSTQNMFLTPFFNEYINITELDSYEYLFVEGANAGAAWGRFIDDIASRMEFLMDKIDRRYEYMCWQYFYTGIVTLSNGTNVKYGRKAGSLVDAGATNYWADAGVNPITGTLARGAAWLNETGKMVGNTIDVIFSPEVWAAWLGNTAVGNNDLKFNNNLTVLANSAVRDSTGKTFLGSTTNGAFNYNFFTYSDFFEDTAGTKYKYTDSKKLLMVPSQAQNVLTYTAVPQLLKPGQMPVASKFTTWTARNEMESAEFTGVKSAGLPTPAAIDQVYTEKVIAG
jgi:hypothetical protein